MTERAGQLHQEASATQVGARHRWHPQFSRQRLSAGRHRGVVVLHCHQGTRRMLRPQLCMLQSGFLSTPRACGCILAQDRATFLRSQYLCKTDQKISQRNWCFFLTTLQTYPNRYPPPVPPASRAFSLSPHGLFNPCALGTSMASTFLMDDKSIQGLILSNTEFVCDPTVTATSIAARRDAAASRVFNAFTWCLRHQLSIWNLIEKAPELACAPSIPLQGPACTRTLVGLSNAKFSA
jgi:hypothetical protein